MKIALLGYGLQNQSAFNYWNKPENKITICNEQPLDETPAGADVKLDSAALSDLHEFDLIVRSPIIHPNKIRLENELHPEVMKKITTNTNEFFRVCPAPIIGVTGTKGKGTTSALISAILTKSGRRVHLGGNIGIPPLDLLKNNIEPDDIVVLELANFQLIDLNYSPHIAVCLMVAPEHLDWHTDMYEYIESKRQMFKHQSSRDLTVYNGNNEYSEEVADVSPAIKLTYQVLPDGEEPDRTEGSYVKGSHIYMYGQKVCNVSDVALLGRHNLENVCAAIAATWDITGGNIAAMQAAIKEFRGLPHRIEFVRQVNKVNFFNDSFASASGATIAAINAIKGPKVMIVGGFNRGLKYTDLAVAIAEHAKDMRKVLLIGETKGNIADALNEIGFKNYEVLEVKDMPTIVATAAKLAQPGDAVILSPGCASFDMFKNFEDRGNQYKAVVSKL